MILLTEAATKLLDALPAEETARLRALNATREGEACR
jgi:hypothetical protein